MNGYRLPEKLMMGVASASAQIEGGKVASNWGEWSREGKILDGSDIANANDHWKRWKEDIDIMAAMGIETYRFSVEWARIQPKPEMVDYEVINHYRKEIEYMRTRGIRPLLTIHHFSNPLWFEKRGAFTLPKNVKYFLKYVGIVVNSFGDLVSDYVTINEPNIYTWMGYGGQGFPPGENNLITVRRVISVLAGCHIRAYEKIHRMRSAMGYDDTKVGMALHMQAFAAMNPLSFFQSRSTALNQYLFQDAVARAFLLGDFRWPIENLGHFKKGVYCDYIGINYYTRSYVAKPGDALSRKQEPKNDFGWGIYPQGLEECMQEIYDLVRLPIWILENGTCDNTDSFRSLFLYDQLAVLARTKLPVERYYHWSFSDNFEWLNGESKRFGLVHIDYETQERTVKKSGRFYREIIANKAVTPDMAERYVRQEKYHS